MKKRYLYPIQSNVIRDWLTISCEVRMECLCITLESMMAVTFT